MHTENRDSPDVYNNYKLLLLLLLIYLLGNNMVQTIQNEHFVTQDYLL